MLAAQRRQCVDDRRIAVVDAGKSTLRAAVFAGGTLLVRRSLPHGLPHPAAPGAQEQVLRRIDDVLELLGHDPFDVLVLAATGVRGIGATETRLQDALGARWGCEAIMENDVVAAYLGALGARPGVLVQAGTGSLVLAACTQGAPVVLDGWGSLAGDRGSGFALGRAGLRAAFAALDGTAPPTSLMPTLTGTDPERTLRELYASGTQTRDVAALAPLVLHAAAEGDEVARGAVESTAAELAALVLAAGRRLEDPQLTGLPVARIGGLFGSALFRDAVARELRAHCPAVHLMDGADDALEGGRLLATTRHDPFTRLLTSAFRNEEP